MIEHKIREVPDRVCRRCPQLWEGECRAFEVPHSEAERLSRKMGTVRGLPQRMSCATYKPVFDTFDWGSIVMLALCIVLLFVFIVVV